ncbi:protein-L-isoaspartate O-methyltransferase family protein [Natronomonas sp. EA1]|uniref:protein-L-isoaspartate O-methyltransferase family protein n=1 Tax=Natronomonas sp. EA1 TaxID=3421655 RepID=UPI003EB7C9FB
MDPAVLREDMVDSLQHASKRAIHTESIGLAMREVPRHEFVEEGEAYADRAFERYGTRILAPSTAARLLEAVAPEPDDRVLVVGAGVGYTAAVLAELVGPENVHAVDIDRRLVYDARENLDRAGYGAVLVDCLDGAGGLPAYAPYDRILVEAAAIDPPARLVSQLAPEGRLVLPVGGGGGQELCRVDASGAVVEQRGTVVFRPLLVDGEQGTTPERNRTVREDREHAARHFERRRGWEQEWIDWDARY